MILRRPVSLLRSAIKAIRTKAGDEAKVFKKSLATCNCAPVRAAQKLLATSMALSAHLVRPTKVSDFPAAVGEMMHFGLSPGWLWAALTILVELGCSALVISGYLVWLGARETSQDVSAGQCYSCCQQGPVPIKNGVHPVRFSLLVIAHHTAQHAQPSTPQNAFRSAIGNLPDQAMA
jgi:hypothetical protein